MAVADGHGLIDASTSEPDWFLPAPAKTETGSPLTPVASMRSSLSIYRYVWNEGGYREDTPSCERLSGYELARLRVVDPDQSVDGVSSVPALRS